MTKVEEIKRELRSFMATGKAKVEVNSGNFVTTHIDMLKIAEHFYEQGLADKARFLSWFDGFYYGKGYEQAEKDFMEKFKMWVAHNGYTAQESELVYNDFKQFITE